jgi:hypothetical protein
MARRGDGIYQRGRICIMLASLCALLGVAASASADCAWVLWGYDRTKPDPENHPVAMAAFDSLGTCQPAMVNEQRAQLAGKEPGRRCFPDTVDPREPKGTK